MTHWRSFSATLSAVLIDGSATLTIETSSTVMNIATQTSARACQRRGSAVMAKRLTPCEDGAHGGGGRQHARLRAGARAAPALELPAGRRPRGQPHGRRREGRG